MHTPAPSGARRSPRASLLLCTAAAFSAACGEDAPAPPRALDAVSPSSVVAPAVPERAELEARPEEESGPAANAQSAPRSTESKAEARSLARVRTKAVDAKQGAAPQLFGEVSSVAGDGGLGGLGLRGAGSGGGGVAMGTAGGAFGGKASTLSSPGISYGSASMAVASGYGSGAGRANVDVNVAPAPLPGGTFHHAGTNPIVDTREDPLSTFAIDVDTGSWMYARRFLKMGRSPAPASVRVEEFVNALHYGYAGPSGDDAFAIHVDAAPSPFTRDRHVVRVAIQGKRMAASARKPAHVTFLVDVSGSMQSPDKLPWVQQAMHMAVDSLRDDDSVAIVTYAGSTGVVLGATPATKKAKIHEAIDNLRPGGGTDMGSGMELAYREANKHLGSDRTSRVIVLSDGDANIGRTSHDQILKQIKGYVSEGVTMSTVGFGTGNYNDVLMEQLADAGNGNYTYIDSSQTMRRVFADELTSTLEVIAQDAKIQVEWNPDVVRTYRLLGYENRDVADADFRNDKKDAGEIGAGHAVTALYEVELASATPTTDLGVVRVRHKVPRHEKAAETALSIHPAFVQASVKDLDADAKAALGIALAAEVLRGSEYAQGLSLVDAAKLLRESAVGRWATERKEAADLLEKAPVQAVAQN
jgi:Ca-activated chloride channel family protein